VRASVSKIAFTFTIPYLQGFQAPFPAIDVSQTFHTLFCESDVKRLRLFAPAGNAREPLFTGTFQVSREGESDFLKRRDASRFFSIYPFLLPQQITGYELIHSL
jgi:hypothetical protein